MTVLIAGASGLLGRALLRHGLGESVVGTAHTRVADGCLALDARSETAVALLFDRVEPAIVVNAIGERRADRWDDALELDAVNVEAAANIAAACERIGAWLIHVSSDYVFDGEHPPYPPDAERKPLNAYGWSKLRAEDRVRELNPGCTVLRLPVLYGPVERLDESNMTSLVPVVLDRTPRSIDDWAVRYPTLTADVAHVVSQMITMSSKLRGVVCHWTAAQGLTKYAMARRIGAAMGVPTEHLTPDPTPRERGSRPRDPRLDCSTLERLGVGWRTDLDEALAELTAALPSR